MKKASFIALLVSSIFLSAGSNAAMAASAEDVFSIAVAENNIYTHISDKTKQAEANTSSKVDAIVLLARADAKNIDDTKVQEAIDWIASHSQTLCGSNKAMEIALYYGGLLDAAFADSDPRSQVGWYAVKATKYVYRGVEKATDPATLRSLKKLQKALDKMK